jgi:hypothetical protein
VVNCKVRIKLSTVSPNWLNTLWSKLNFRICGRT